MEKCERQFAVFTHMHFAHSHFVSIFVNILDVFVVILPMVWWSWSFSCHRFTKSLSVIYSMFYISFGHNTFNTAEPFELIAMSSQKWRNATEKVKLRIDDESEIHLLESVVWWGNHRKNNIKTHSLALHSRCVHKRANLKKNCQQFWLSKELNENAKSWINWYKKPAIWFTRQNKTRNKTIDGKCSITNI